MIADAFMAFLTIIVVVFLSLQNKINKIVYERLNKIEQDQDREVVP